MTYRYPGGLVRRTAANTSITGASGVWDLGSQAQAVRNNTWPISGLANPVSGSLRFRASASAWLNRTFGTPTLSTKWTWSGWFKLGSLTGTNKIIFDGGSPDTRLVLQDISNGAEQLIVGNDTTTFLATSAVYRDYSAWYHAVLAFDSSQGTASNRLRLYINGSEVTAFATDNRSSISGAIGINTATAHGIGKQPAGGVAFFDGYMAEVNFIDGQQLTPSSFGQTSPITGVWEPIKYTGTYGNNGFYLSLSDTSSIGKDFSGNGNNWTPNNISTASGSTFDLMRDVPTQYTPQGVTDVGGVVRGNYATLNPLVAGTSSTLSNGNLTYTNSAGTGNQALSSMFVTSGSYYFEATLTTAGGGGTSLYVNVGDGNTYYATNGEIYSGGVLQTTVATLTSGDVVGLAFTVGGSVTYYKNGTSVFTGGVGGIVPFVNGFSGTVWNVNFGQRPFAYTPPSGFNSLCTTNLPTPTIGATTATAANKYFDALLYTGAGGTQTISGLQFQPDFIWGKARSAAYSHALFDSVRGYGSTKGFLSNSNAAEGVVSAQYGFVSTNTPTGFTAAAGNDGSNPNAALNESGVTYVAWNWNAGGSTVTNTAGSITTSVRASPTAGFSIITYSGNGTGGATIGHGLGVAPSMMIFKPRNATGSALVWHTGYNSNQAQMLLDSTAAIYNPGNGLYFNSTYPSSTVATLGTSSSVNDATYTYVAYMFASVAGYSAFGSYTGNGSTDGTFVYTGFRPRFLIVKRTNDIGSWIMTDSARSTYNVTGELFNANTGGAEFTTGDIKFDYLSNGFKLREVNGAINASGSTYIYMAFAENPFKNSLAR
jgi:hypothetical protein